MGLYAMKLLAYSFCADVNAWQFGSLLLLSQLLRALVTITCTLICTLQLYNLCCSCSEILHNTTI